MADPAPPNGLPNAEFIELYNRTKDKTFDLKGYKIYNGATPNIIDVSFKLKPEHYVLIHKKKQGIDFTK